MPTLIVVGSGIKSLAHLTEETQRIIKQADKTLYLVNENHLKQWIEREAKVAESLELLYFSSEKRIDTYQKITDYIVDQYHLMNVLCVVFYGHPAVFADSALHAVKCIQAEQGNAFILPAISAMDCLFSDLQVDPGQHGCQMIDATELLLFERQLDTCAQVILWQIGNLGQADTKISNKLSILSDYLQLFYHPQHRICLYEAAILPFAKPRIEWINIEFLETAEIHQTTSLYIPPSEKKALSQKYLSLLEIKKEDFCLSTDTHTATK